MFDFSIEIANRVLNYLQGWRLQSEEEYIGDGSQKVAVEPYLTEYDYATIQDTKQVTVRELKGVWEEVLLLVESYLFRDLNEVELSSDGFVVESAICMWTAGLIWKKYNLRVIDQEDDTNITGYGDNLIISAKSMLKPYRYNKLSIFH